MKKILIATKNLGKFNEFKDFLKQLSFELVSLEDLKIDKDIKEDGKTYRQNSVKKALFFAKISNLLTIADDGGIEISALNNKPGIQTRRWLGHHSTDEELINHMFKILKILPDNNRKARFRTIVSFALPNGKVFSRAGQVNGIISKNPKPNFIKGYPFRSFFYLPKIKKFFYENELSNLEQKLYNHRYKAIQKLIPIIKKYA
ncbi:MAG: hypothetical protein HYT06_01890 [Candidatus Levybacteria bacterium]|nr:hypothetical protein [Candidatus Levybacteria bacterium]